MEKDVEIGIFGGTGIYDSGLLKETREITIDTPYGNHLIQLQLVSLMEEKLHFYQDMEKSIRFHHT